jgi:hypothetical protein
LQTVARRVRVRNLEIDPAFLPGRDQEETVSSALAGDRFFAACGAYVLQATFHTNPFDALHEIAQAIACIQGEASRAGRFIGGILPYEVTFGMFVGAVLATGPPNFEELAEFVIDFAPVGGMCPAFEFAAATTRAALLHCRALAGAPEEP